MTTAIVDISLKDYNFWRYFFSPHTPHPPHTPHLPISPPPHLPIPHLTDYARCAPG
ncbi:hypothetical protein [Fortiea contorta]|uniref:hypothetical protein n=1 Tax=Fortiea contorta TaxID=1892405 RepID=UPI000346AA64|nr:hypothetical protein [Fortiea contorta]